MIPLRSIAAVAALAATGLAGYKIGHGVVTITLNAERAAWANERTKASDASRQLETQYRAQEQRMIQQREQSIGIANDQIDKLQTALRASNASSVSLRNQYALFVASNTRAAEAAATEPEREAAAAGAGVSAELFGELERRATIYAEAADRARIAGLACERER